METGPKSSPRQAFVTLVVITAVIIWLLNAFNTGNPLWFLPFQPTYVPSRIIVRNDGTAVTLTPGQPQFQLLQEALDKSLSAFRNSSLGNLGLSDETLRRYHEEELVLEIYYPQDISFNTPVRMEHINQLLIPIDGTHAGHGNVFLGSSGRWLIGVMVMENPQPLLNAMRALGYLE